MLYQLSYSRDTTLAVGGPGEQKLAKGLEPITC